MGSKQEVLNHYLTRYMTRLNGGFCILSGNLLILLVRPTGLEPVTYGLEERRSVYNSL
ncbi:hypothetical protein YPSE1_28220 [Yersinia pseudotuberculosis]|nr:hypothetical protein YPSE1_28220 [Yersinia pseudotuberculosis]